jgi:WXXGXW repeat (2 copies)
VRIHSLRAALIASLLLILSSGSFAQLRVSVSFGPPALPVYEQPLCPGDGYIWTPGYWAWSDDYGDYYWVPGTWVLAPEPGYLWTPPYWAWVGGSYVFYEGYWGPHVGFYGGINYGFGYFGEGFAGGRWQGDRFYYNRSVTNVNVTNVRNVYNTTVVNNNTTINRVSYNGGNGGVVARPTPEQEAAAHERHLPPASAQTQQVQDARRDPQFRASENRGKPPVAATPRPGEFKGNGAVAAREAGAPYNPHENRAFTNPSRGATPEGGAARPAPVHPNDLPPMNRPEPPNTGNAKRDQQYQRDQQKLQQKQDKERQKLQAQQEKEHQQLAKKSADEAHKQQMEQRHQQQTQQLQQRHTQQQQQMQQRQAPPAHPAEQRPSKGRP